MAERDGRVRVIIDGVKPEVDCGRFPIKRTVGDEVMVEADIFADGHDTVSAMLLYRKNGDDRWTEVPMMPLVNDRWRASFKTVEVGCYRYTIVAWVDRFKTWRRNLSKKVDAGFDISIELLVGAEIVAEASGRTSRRDGENLRNYADKLRSAETPDVERIKLALSDELARHVEETSDRWCATMYPRELVVVVDRERARFSSWYEMFPRSCTSDPRRHGTFKDCEDRLPYIVGMGFDVLYFPPIHPIGITNRKGKNNLPTANADDPGSPWAVGASEGGHKTVNPCLGTLDDFRSLIARAKQFGIEIALDLAFNCTPDHPYAKEHPEWFRFRPDGTVQYAENPPKKYEDIYPFGFETEHWQELWNELRSVVLFWIDHGIRIFRVDNPHTKPFAFWEWLINEVKSQYPEVIFLSEAFTRPKVMFRLAKLGFTQSYTYFTWRNTRWEITQYMKELAQTDVREYMRPSLWINTPDILTEYLQTGGRPAFIVRLVLAATLGASYGIYGPAFELCENRAREMGSEEYLDSEKYEIRQWDIGRFDSLSNLIARVNRIRHENPALQSDWCLHFHHVDNEQLICYSKQTDDLTNSLLVVVNLDPHNTQSGWVELDLAHLGLNEHELYQVHDLLTGARYLWHGWRNRVELNPSVIPAHIFQLRRRLRTERDFDYYL